MMPEPAGVRHNGHGIRCYRTFCLLRRSWRCRGRAAWLAART